MGKRLARLIDGGNKYTAAVVAVNEQGVSIMIRETFKDRSLQNVCSFPSKVNVNNEDLGYRSENMARFIREDDTDVDSDADVETDEEEGQESRCLSPDRLLRPPPLPHSSHRFPPTT